MSARLDLIPKNVKILVRCGHPFHAIGYVLSVIAYCMFASIVVPILAVLEMIGRSAEYLANMQWLGAPVDWYERYYEYQRKLVKEAAHETK